MVHVCLPPRELQTCLHEARHREEALLGGVYSLLQFLDVLLGGEESGRADEFG
jgi:hypothetical protein